jgi:acyl transferase domain-containing protein
MSFPHPASSLVRALASTWVQLRGVERHGIQVSAGGREVYLRQSRQQLRELAAEIAEKGVTVPREIIDYLAEHPS